MKERIYNGPLAAGDSVVKLDQALPGGERWVKNFAGTCPASGTGRQILRDPPRRRGMSGIIGPGLSAAGEWVENLAVPFPAPGTG